MGSSSSPSNYTRFFGRLVSSVPKDSGGSKPSHGFLQNSSLSNDHNQRQNHHLGLISRNVNHLQSPIQNRLHSTILNSPGYQPPLSLNSPLMNANAAGSRIVNPWSRGLNILNNTTQTLGVPSASNNITPSQLFQDPVDQGPGQNHHVPPNQMKPSGAKGEISESKDDYSLSFIISGGSDNRARSRETENITYSIPILEKKDKPASLILGKRPNPSSMEAIDKHAGNGSLIILDSPEREGTDQTRIPRRGRKPDSQKINELREKIQAGNPGEGDLYEKLIRGPCMPSLMKSNGYLFGSSNVPISSTDSPPTIERGRVDLIRSSPIEPLPMNIFGGFTPGNSRSDGINMHKRYKSIAGSSSTPPIHGTSSSSRLAKRISIYDCNWKHYSPPAPESVDIRKWEPINLELEGDNRGKGIIGDLQIGSSFNGRYNQSFQTIPFFAPETQIQSSKSREIIDLVEIDPDASDQIVSNLSNLPVEHESGQIDQLNKLLSLPANETPQQVDFSNQVLLENRSMTKSPAILPFSLDEPKKNHTSGENENVNVVGNLQNPKECRNSGSADDPIILESLETDVAVENTSNVASIPILEEKDFEDLINWPEHYLVGFDRYGFEI